MRGKLESVLAVIAVPRITPADAGKTAQEGNRKRGKQDHPRGCGENQTPPQCGRWERGSPPRMRGKRPKSLLRQLPNRITPADAGKTGVPRVSWDWMWDHPRGCGENHNVIATAIKTQGSPPRMRGKLAGTAIGSIAGRITPADAGKTEEQQNEK